MLREVIIRSNCTDKQCEEAINTAIADHPNSEVLFDMLIENTVSGLNFNQRTQYTLMIRIEDGE